jgi:hypothetical protein
VLNDLERVLVLKVSTKAATKARNTYNRALHKVKAAHNALIRAGGHGYLKLDDIERAIEASKPRRVYYAVDPSTSSAGDVRVGGRKTRKAAELALELLTRWRPDDIVTTKGKTWSKLAAILYGDKDADLYQHLRVLDMRRTK